MSQLTPEERAELAYYSGYEPPEPVRHEPRFRILRKLATPLILLGALLWKFKFIAAAIFKFKIITTSATMLVSVGAYALFWGWKFALGFVLLMLVHELGHVLEAKRQGIPVSAPIFIPFLGAAIIPKEAFANVWAEAKMAAAARSSAASALPRYGLPGRSTTPSCSLRSPSPAFCSTSSTSCRSLRSTAAGWRRRCIPRSGSSASWGSPP